MGGQPKKAQSSGFDFSKNIEVFLIMAASDPEFAASFYQTIAEHNIEENQKITNSKDTTTDRLNLDRSDMLY